jgi:hypothetical protein
MNVRRVGIITFRYVIISQQSQQSKKELQALSLINVTLVLHFSLTQIFLENQSDDESDEKKRSNRDEKLQKQSRLEKRKPHLSQT